MSKHIISNGNVRLEGDVRISGSKNASLPILAACLLFSSKVRLKNLAQLKDISVLLSLLASLNVKLCFEQDHIELDVSEVEYHELPEQESSLIRASVLLLGPLLARFQKVSLPMPGGCKIGKRPIDFHLYAVEQLGATVQYDNDRVIATAPNGLRPGNIKFPLPSVTATENAIMAASLLHGTTTIENASKDSEVHDLVNFLKKSGIKIEVEDSTITVHGNGGLIDPPGEFTIMSDRMELGTWIAAAGITRSKLTLTHEKISQLETVIDHAESVGIHIHQFPGYMIVDARYALKAQSFTTGFHPDFPTDLQAPFAALNATCPGSWSIKETIWENRFHHIEQFIKFGVNTVHIDHQKVTNKEKFPCRLVGATVYGKDLRGTCSLLLLSLVAEGKTYIIDSQHIERGYQNFIEKLNKLGASIQQINAQTQIIEESNQAVVHSKVHSVSS